MAVLDILRRAGARAPRDSGARRSASVTGGSEDLASDLARQRIYLVLSTDVVGVMEGVQTRSDIGDLIDVIDRALYNLRSLIAATPYP